MISDVAAYSDESWARLGDAIRRRRVALRLTQEDLADKAGVSVNTIRNLEQGRRARELTLPRITDALGWVGGSYFLILDGGDPLVEETPEEENDDALRLERPEGISDAEWNRVKAKVLRDVRWYLGGDGDD